MKIKLVPYKDLWIRLGLSALLAFFFEFLGEESFASVVGHWMFIPDLLAGFILVFVITSWVRFVSMRMDKKFPWNKKLLPRILLQFLLGVVVPSLFVLAYVYVYLYPVMKAYKEEVVFFEAEFPIAVLLIIFWNLVYVGYFFAAESKKEKKEPPSI